MIKEELFGLIFTLVVGLAFIFDLLLLKLFKNKKYFTYLFGLTFSIMIGMIIFDIFPEILEIFKFFELVPKILYIVLSVIGGFLLLFFLDRFVPEHEHSDKKEKHDKHISHIGFVSAFALILHNFIEGLAIYSITLTSVKSGILMMFAVILHNIPLGMSIISTFNTTKAKKIVIMILLVISSVLGGISGLLIDFNEVFLGILIAITLGMLIYVIIFEILHEIVFTKEKKQAILGVISGIVIMIIAMLFE